MGKTNFLRYPFKVLITILLSVISGCGKVDKYDPDLLLGIWKGIDSVYNLEFTSENDFLKNGDHYFYLISGDSMTIQYRGVLYIAIEPTTHAYKLENSLLTIDFRSGCYGFESKEIVFKREQPM